MGCRDRRRLSTLFKRRREWIQNSRKIGRRSPRAALDRAERGRRAESPRAALYIIPAARYFIHRDLSISSVPSPFFSALSLSPPLSRYLVDFQLGMRSSRDLNKVSLRSILLLLPRSSLNKVPRKFLGRGSLSLSEKNFLFS